MRDFWILIAISVAFSLGVTSVTCIGDFDRHGCPDGWVTYEASCYLFDVEQKFDWTEAGHFCSNHASANLVIIDSLGEHNFLKDFLRKFSRQGTSDYYWIGATDDEVEGVWTWYTDHRRVANGYHGWQPGEPDNVGNQDCGCLVHVFDFNMGDSHCNGHQWVICEKNVTATEMTEVIG